VARGAENGSNGREKQTKTSAHEPFGAKLSAVPDAIDPNDDARLARIERSALRLIASTIVLYASIVVWAYFAMRLPGVAVMLPAVIVFGAFIVRRAMARRRRVRSARRTIEAARSFLRAHFDGRIRGARLFRIFAPILVAFTWALVLALRVRGNTVYWCGAIAVGIFLLVAAIVAHFAIPRLMRERALYD
jgi:hypothetical protein